ncbi:hypothetical protein L9F63_011948, partial [Diploptera punctata]
IMTISFFYGNGLDFYNPSKLKIFFLMSPHQWKRRSTEKRDDINNYSILFALRRKCNKHNFIVVEAENYDVIPFLQQLGKCIRYVGSSEDEFISVFDFKLYCMENRFHNYQKQMFEESNGTNMKHVFVSMLRDQ